MSREPIFERLRLDAEHILHREHHQRAMPHIEQACAERTYDDRDSTTPSTKGTPMTNVLTEIHDAVAEGIENIEGWASTLKEKLPDLAAKAEKFAGSPILKALEDLGEIVLPPAAEQEVAALIGVLGKIVKGAETVASDLTGTSSGTSAADSSTSTPASDSPTVNPITGSSAATTADSTPTPAAS